MKKLIWGFLNLLLISGSIDCARGQQVISSAGNYYETGGISLSWTIGECVIATFGNEDIVLTQGFQQPFVSFAGQWLNIPSGWSGISSWVDPSTPMAANVVDEVVSELIILRNPFSQVYWPAMGVNQIDPPPAGEPGWVSHHGYIVKMTNSVSLLIQGTAETDLTVDLPAGWFIMPVLSQEAVSSNMLFGQLNPSLVIVKEIAGNRIWWPAMEIYTLTGAEPGKSYQVLLSSSDVLDFTPMNSPAPAGPTNIELNHLVNNTRWNDVVFSASSHTIAIGKDAWNMLDGLSYGDYLGVFTRNGLCSGMIIYTGKEEALAITAFGDDPTTPSSLEGFPGNEQMSFRLFRTSTNEEFEITATFDPSLPNMDVFQENGLSKIVEMTLMATSIAEHGLKNVEVYPNPANDRVMIQCIGNISQDARLSVYSIGSGKLVREARLEDNLTELDIQDLAQGVYFIRITDGHQIIIKKLVRQANEFRH